MGQDRRSLRLDDAGRCGLTYSAQIGKHNPLKGVEKPNFFSCHSEEKNLRFFPFHFKVLSYPRSRPLDVCLYAFGSRAGILHLTTAVLLLSWFFRLIKYFQLPVDKAGGVCYNLCINATTEPFHRGKRAQRTGGWCKPGAQETELSLPSRIAEPEGVGGYGLPRYQGKGYESIRRAPVVRRESGWYRDCIDRP